MTKLNRQNMFQKKANRIKLILNKNSLLKKLGHLKNEEANWLIKWKKLNKKCIKDIIKF